jgi:hypothetical protein
VELLVGVATEKSLLYTILYLLISDVLNCFCKNLVFEFLFKALLTSLYLIYCRCKDNLIEKLFRGLPTRIYFSSNVALYLKID